MKKSALLSFAFLLLSAVYANAQSRVRFHTTMGDITVKLYDETPRHRDNFLKLVKDSTYNGLLFHRTISRFMIQAGDPNSRNAKPGQLLGDGDLGYTVEAEIRYPQLFHKRGALCAAREDGNPNSSASQFYIVTGAQYTENMLTRAQQRMDEYTGGKYKMPSEVADVYRKVGGAAHLDGSYTVFGEVVMGMDVADEISNVEVDTNARPLKDIRILSTTIYDGSNLRNMNIDEFESYIANSNVQLVDVRTAEEYANAHLVGAINIDMKQADFMQKASTLLDKNRPVAVYCRSGKRSSISAEWLTEAGYRVANMQGGFLAWKEAGKKTQL